MMSDDMEMRIFDGGFEPMDEFERMFDPPSLDPTGLDEIDEFAHALPDPTQELIDDTGVGVDNVNDAYLGEDVLDQQQPPPVVFQPVIAPPPVVETTEVLYRKRKNNFMDQEEVSKRIAVNNSPTSIAPPEQKKAIEIPASVLSDFTVEDSEKKVSPSSAVEPESETQTAPIRNAVEQEIAPPVKPLTKYIVDTSLTKQQIQSALDKPVEYPSNEDIYAELHNFKEETILDIGLNCRSAGDLLSGRLARMSNSVLKDKTSSYLVS